MSAQPKETLEEMLKLLRFSATVESTPLDEGVILDIDTDDPGRLIGRQGQTLSQFQYVLNRMLFRQDRDAPKVTLDVGNYRLKSREALITKAKEAAEKARRWGDVIELEPMNAFERRIVHHALKDNEHVESNSVEVEGTSNKAILLRPKQ
jgi:spoIIIJ-associated protein